MAYRTLADFLEDLGRAGELAAVDAEVDPCLEVAEITRRVARQNGPALLFRNVKGRDIPLVTNLFGTESRILRALGAESIEEATARIDRALNGGGEGWLERLRLGGKSGAATGYAATRVKTGACQQVVRLGSDVNLLELPLIAQGWAPNKPAIRSALMLSADPESHAQVFLRGNLQIESRDTAVVAWLEVADPSRIAKACGDVGRRMPVAIIIGGDPAVQLAAAAPLPFAVDPLGLAGLLREKPLDAVACHSVDLLVPAESDLIIEGWIDPAEHASIDGPYFLHGANHLHVTAVTHRANRVFPAVVPDIDNNECSICDRLLARLFLPYLKTRIPDLVDFDLPLSGRARRLAILAIEKSYETQPEHVATVAWGVRPFQSAQLLIVVDAEIDVRDMEQVMAAIIRQLDAKNNIMVLDSTLDSWIRTQRRTAIDATRRYAPVRDVPTESLVTERWAEYGLGPEPDE
jgi:4-hydroxy-3-polyprenylbenzoate decarboxylase